MGERLLLARPVLGVGSEGSGLCQVEPFARGLLFIFFKTSRKELEVPGCGCRVGASLLRDREKIRKEGLVINRQRFNAPLDLVAVINTMAPPKSLGSSGGQGGGSLKGILEFSA